MKTLKFTLVGLSILLIGSPLMANTSLSVTGAAAMDGTNYGLVVTFDGGTGNAYVEDQSPANETTYRVSFWIDRSGGITMTNCGGTCISAHTLLIARDDIDGTIGAGDKTIVRLLFRRLKLDNASGPRYSIMYGTFQNNGTWRYVGGVVLSETSLRKNIMIEWQAGNGNGLARIYSRNSSAGSWTLKGEVTGLTNDTYNIDYVRFGATSAVDTTTSGDLWLDEFESYRTLAP